MKFSVFLAFFVKTPFSTKLVEKGCFQELPRLKRLLMFLRKLQNEIGTFLVFVISSSNSLVLVSFLYFKFYVCCKELGTHHEQR